MGRRQVDEGEVPCRFLFLVLRSGGDLRHVCADIGWPVDKFNRECGKGVVRDSGPDDECMMDQFNLEWPLVASLLLSLHVLGYSSS